MSKIKFKKEFTKELEEYFSIDSNRFEDIETFGKNDYHKIDKKEFANNLPTLQKFCYQISIHRDTFYQWLKDADDEKYLKEDKVDKKILSDTYKRMKLNQESIWLENGLKGLYNPAFAIFIGKNVFGYKDKIEVKQKNLNYNTILTKEELEKMGSKDCDKYLSKIINDE